MSSRPLRGAWPWGWPEPSRSCRPALRALLLGGCTPVCSSTPKYAVYVTCFVLLCSNWGTCLSLVIILLSVGTREGGERGMERCGGQRCGRRSPAPAGRGGHPPLPSAQHGEGRAALRVPASPRALLGSVTWPSSVKYSEEQICASVSSSCQTMQVTGLQLCACILQSLVYSESGTVLPLHYVAKCFSCLLPVIALLGR